jgi:hypothetical protein
LGGATIMPDGVSLNGNVAANSRDRRMAVRHERMSKF